VSPDLSALPDDDLHQHDQRCRYDPDDMSMTLRLALLDDTGALAQFDQVLGIEAGGLTVGMAGDQEVDGAGEDLVASVRTTSNDKSYLHRNDFRFFISSKSEMSWS
jgi:hypothetical protein